jgi:uncharacterized protein YndB with AHSA1/START domain
VEQVARGGVEIDRPAEDVFGYLADMRNEPRWCPVPPMYSSRRRNRSGQAAGFEGTYARAGKVRCDLRDFEPPRRLTIHVEAGGLSFDDTVTLTATGTGTKLVAEMRTVPKGLFKLVAPACRARRRPNGAAAQIRR